jgi:6-phosphogluconolactonase (cycloisomerase 2 family)
VLQYFIQPNGILAANGSLVLTSNASSRLLQIVTTTPAPSLKCAYAIDFGLSVLWEMNIDPATGVLSLSGSVPLTESPSAIAVHPNQKFIYVPTAALPSHIFFGTAYRSEISVFTLSEKDEKSHSCALTLTSLLSVSDFASSIAVEPMGQYAYTANRTSATVGEYSIDSRGIAERCGNRERAV